MFNTCRWYFRYGNEGDPMDCTFKEFDAMDKAIKYARRYATGIRFAGVEIEDNNGNLLFEIDNNFEETDYREAV